MHLRAVFPSGAIGEIEPTIGGASFITISERANRTPRFKARLFREPQRGNGGNGRPRVYAPSSARCRKRTAAPGRDDRLDDHQASVRRAAGGRSPAFQLVADICRNEAQVEEFWSGFSHRLLLGRRRDPYLRHYQLGVPALDRVAQRDFRASGPDELLDCLAMSPDELLV